MQHRHAAMERKHGNYGRLAAMVVLSFAAMYALMYAMVDRPGNVLMNFNQAYMAALMAAPMIFIELALMRSMYPDRKRNAVLLAVGAIVLVGAWQLIRDQGAISDRQFLRSMIPHHAAAILMCRQAPIRDQGVVDLCRRIVASQEAEIREMKERLASL
jgi:uncharacterized protein (DUF305 family)